MNYNVYRINSKTGEAYCFYEESIIEEEIQKCKANDIISVYIEKLELLTGRSYLTPYTGPTTLVECGENGEMKYYDIHINQDISSFVKNQRFPVNPEQA